jgi:hypothetical protein
VKANASKHKAMSHDRMEKDAARLRQKVKELLAAAEAADVQEDDDEAHDWYRVAVETALPREAEHHFAMSQLGLWSREGKSLARIAKDALP